MRKTKDNGSDKGAGSVQMGGASTAPQPQQSGGAPRPEEGPQKPVRFTDWASI